MPTVTPKILLRTSRSTSFSEGRLNRLTTNPPLQDWALLVAVAGALDAGFDPALRPLRAVGIGVGHAGHIVLAVEPRVAGLDLDGDAGLEVRVAPRHALARDEAHAQLLELRLGDRVGGLHRRHRDVDVVPHRLAELLRRRPRVLRAERRPRRGGLADALRLLL